MEDSQSSEQITVSAVMHILLHKMTSLTAYASLFLVNIISEYICIVLRKAIQNKQQMLWDNIKQGDKNPSNKFFFTNCTCAKSIS